MHDLINAVAEDSPDSVALIWNDDALTFRELNSQANQLAHHLISLGLQDSEVIGIALHRHPDFVIAILAVLKAGFTYVPLDVTYPQDRLRYISASSGHSLLITAPEVAHLFPGARTLLLKDALIAAQRFPGRPRHYRPAWKRRVCDSHIRLNRLAQRGSRKTQEHRAVRDCAATRDGRIPDGYLFAYGIILVLRVR